MTSEQEHEFCSAAGLGIACGLNHRYEWYVNATRALMRGPYIEMPTRQTAILRSFVAFEKTIASCPEEQTELDSLDAKAFTTRVNEWYRQSAKEQL